MKKGFFLLLLVAGIFYMMSSKSEIKNFPNNNETIVAFGDSLTAGYGAPKGASYPDYLAEKLGKPVVNLGQSGELAVQAPKRIADVLSHEPYMVLIEFGANDFMQQRSTKEAVSAVRQIVDEVQKAGAIAVIVDTGGPNMDEYTTAYKKMAQETNSLFVPSILRGIFTKPSLKSDMVHPNAAGYEIVADKVYDVIKDYVK